ncbi:unnamed protein product [Arctia plantaginis]|uniref:Uncharacterized protein n=1 Tax=Arctia plantaginis TaxID=874455 RepID=A0A8S0ZPC5_ARCPL|nr:unnamed protein product [Arctia plantaginis]
MLILRVKIKTKRWCAKVCGARIQLPRFDSQSGVKLPIEEHVAVDELARGGWESRRSLGAEVLTECSLSSEKMPPRKKTTREERLERKRIAERLRYQRIKNDKDKYAQQKIKEREKYEKKKEKGVIKTVQQMTPREQRKLRKVWREKAKIRRRRLALQDISNAPETPPCSDSEDPPPPQNINRRAQAAQQKSIRARKARNLIIRKQEAEISQLKSAVQRYKKQIQRIKKPPISTPNTKVNSLNSRRQRNYKEETAFQ